MQAKHEHSVPRLERVFVLDLIGVVVVVPVVVVSASVQPVRVGLVGGKREREDGKGDGHVAGPDTGDACTDCKDRARDADHHHVVGKHCESESRK